MSSPMTYHKQGSTTSPLSREEMLERREAWVALGGNRLGKRKCSETIGTPLVQQTELKGGLCLVNRIYRCEWLDGKQGHGRRCAWYGDGISPARIRLDECMEEVVPSRKEIEGETAE